MYIGVASISASRLNSKTLVCHACELPTYTTLGLRAHKANKSQAIMSNARLPLATQRTPTQLNSCSQTKTPRTQTKQPHWALCTPQAAQLTTLFNSSRMNETTQPRTHQRRWSKLRLKRRVVGGARNYWILYPSVRLCMCSTMEHMNW